VILMPNRPGDLEPLFFSWPVSRILEDICTRAGVPFDKINTSNITAYCDGFSTTNDHSVSSAIETLGQVFLFDCASFNGTLNFVPRGGDVDFIIDPDDIIEQESGDDKSTRKDSVSIPKVLWLSYFDVDGALNPDTQYSDRSFDNRNQEDSKVDTPVIMRADDAKRAVVINHKVMIEEQQGERTFSLPDKYLGIVPTSIVSIDGERLRITEVELDEGAQHYTAIRDRQSAYTSTANGVASNPPITPPDLLVGNTALFFIDSHILSHILSDSDDQLGYYIAVCGTTSNWSGCLIEFSRDGGANYTDSSETTLESTCGVVTTDFPSASQYYPDQVNTFGVRLYREDMELFDATYEQVLSRTNLAIVGNEIINFETAAEIEPGFYAISDLLRGRKGTAPVDHIIGERFILLERPYLTFIPAEAYDLGKELTFRVTSYGDDTAITQTFTMSGLSQTERKIENLKAYRNDTSLKITWFATGNLGGGSATRNGSYFNYYEYSINDGTWIQTLNTEVIITDPGIGTNIKVREVNRLTGAGEYSEITV